MTFSLERCKVALDLRCFFSELPSGKIPGPTATALVCDSSFSFSSLLSLTTFYRSLIKTKTRNIYTPFSALQVLLQESQQPDIGGTTAQLSFVPLNASAREQVRALVPRSGRLVIRVEFPPQDTRKYQWVFTCTREI